MVNIKAVAKNAHVSVATVSRVINNKGYVNEETRKLVEDAIKNLNYIPNEFARSLLKNVSKTIGVIFPHLSNPFYYSVLEGIEEIAFEQGYKVMICNTHEDAERENEYIKQFVKYHIDGIIIASKSDLIAKYKELNIPLVSIDRIIDDSVPSVMSDNAGGGMLAAQKMVQTGCKKIVHFRGPSVLLTVQERTKGFQQVLGENGLECDKVDLAFVNPERDLIKNYLENHPDVEGVFCDSDTIAAIAVTELQRLGKQIPQEVQVIGYDNTILAELMNPNLTTISQQMYNIGEAALESLERLIEKDELTQTHKLIPVELIERGTTRNS